MSKIRQHEPAASGHCLWCGAKPDGDGGFGERTCLERAAPMPEPARRGLVCEDIEAISARLAELAAERAAVTAAEPAAEPAAMDHGDCCV